MVRSTFSAFLEQICAQGSEWRGGGGRIDSRQVNTRTVLQVPHHDGRALASKSLGDAEADSGRGCCDQTDFAGQTRTG